MNDYQLTDIRNQRHEGSGGDQTMTSQDLTRLLRRHLWLVLLILVASLVTAGLISRRTPPAWRASAELLLVQHSPVMVATPQVISNPPMIESLETQVSLLQSRALAQAAAQRAGVSAQAIQNSLTVLPSKDGDNVIDLSVEADSHQHAIDWANALCLAFVDYKKSVAQRTSQETLANLKGQEAQADKQRREADAQLLDFQRSHRLSGIAVLDAQAQKTAALNAVVAQEAVVAGFRNEYATAEAKADSLENQLRTADAAIKGGTGVRDNGEIIKMQEDLHDLQRTRAQTALKYKAKFPGRLSLLDAEVSDTQARLNRAIQTLQSQPSLEAQETLKAASETARSDANSARVKLDAAVRQRDELQGETAALPQISMEADKLTQNADQSHTLYNSLSAAVRAAQLDQDVASGNVQIVQPAFAPDAPFRPDHKRDLLVGLGVGLFLSLAAVLMREQSDRSVRAVSDARRLADGPITGVLPQLTPAQRAQFGRGETPPQMIEAYNTVRASLSRTMRAGAGTRFGSNVVVVSSTVSGEGKSLTASELAQSFARAGQRVVLVNADMRRPSSLPLLRDGKQATPGLADVLNGKAGSVEALVESDVPNLLLLRSGTPARNPMDLLSRPQMGEAIRALREAADVVVIDTPPTAVVSDALLLAPYADRLLYVIAIGMADADSIKNNAAALSAAAPDRMSYFINRAPRPSAVSSYYDTYYQDTPHVPVAEDARDHSAWRTMLLDRAGLPTLSEAAAPAAPEKTTPSAPPGPADEGVGEKTGLWVRPAVRVLPEIGSHLVALEGPYFGQKFALSPSKPLTFGILPDNDVVLARDGTISRRHARITAEEGGYVLYDAGATNGTFVNDVKVTHQPLRVGDVVQFGASKFRYE